MKAIDTIYNGYKFRSRLEARWAVYFTEIGWQYDYEKEGFELEDGTWYLPDFYLPQIHTWIEVKPDIVTEEDIRKCMLFSKGLGTSANVVIVNNLPAPVQYPCFCDGRELGGVTLSVYIRWKGWQEPYFGGDWVAEDLKAFEVAKQARFEHGETPG